MFSNFILIIHFILLHLINSILIFFMLHQCCRREGSNNGLPRGLKCYPTKFMRLSYYKDLKIVHLFDTMHIRKNVTETLWRIIDGRRDKEKNVKICNDIQESNHAMQSVIRSNNDGVQNNLPWLLTEQQSNDVKEVIQKIKFPIGFCSNIKNNTFFKVNVDGGEALEISS
jgi:hypothetical protein